MGTKPLIVKTNDTPKGWLLPNKEYKVTDTYGHRDGLGGSFSVIAEHGMEIYTNQFCSEHLCGGNWEIVEYEGGNILKLKSLLAKKQAAQSILDDDTVNSWGANHTPNYTPEQVKQAAEDFNEAQKEIDKIISEL